MRFDFAISFAGQERELARHLADVLTAKGFRVFFDEHFEHEMLGQDGAAYLNDVFFRQSRFCVALISRSYQQRAWAQHERRAAQARELGPGPGFLLPVVVDDARPEWLLPTRIYFDLSQRDLPALIGVLERKMMVEGRGPYVITAEFENIDGSKYLKVAAAENADEYVVWRTEGDRAPAHRVFREDRLASWSVARLPFEGPAREVIPTRGGRAVLSRPDGIIRVYDAESGGAHDLAEPCGRSPYDRYSLEHDSRGALLVIAYSAGDVWLLHTERLSLRKLWEAPCGDFGSCPAFVSDEAVVISAGRDLHLCRLEDGSLQRIGAMPQEIEGLRYASLSSRLIVVLGRRLYVINFPAGDVAYQHVAAAPHVFSLVAARQADLVAFTAGLPLGNVLEVYDAAFGISVCQMESDYRTPWGQLALAPDGSSLAVVRGNGVVILERGSG